MSPFFNDSNRHQLALKAFVCSFLLAFGLLQGPEARSATETRVTPYELSFPTSPLVAATAVVMWTGPMPFYENLVEPTCPCDPSRINGLDRPFAGRGRDLIAAQRSDQLSTFTNVAPLLVDGVSVYVSGGTWADYGTDLFVIYQAIAINGALTQLTKVIGNRPRPFLYGGNASGDDLEDREHYLSFYSGHTSNAFAGGFALAQTLAYRYSDRPAIPIAAYTLAFGAGAYMGHLRVKAGWHFPTDVLTGAVAGAAIGILVPMIHHRQKHSMRTWAIGVKPAPEPRLVLSIQL